VNDRWTEEELQLRGDIRSRCRLMAVAALVLLSACASAPASIPSAPAAASPAIEATPPPTDTPTATKPSTGSPMATATEEASTDLGPDAVGRVVTSDLVVRSLPEISDASTILEPHLDEPTLLYVVAGPVSANGYGWYQVQPFGMHYLDFMAGPPPFGWVAEASRGGEPWIAAATIDCPEPDIDALRAMSTFARLACYGDRELTVDGTVGGCFAGDPIPGGPHYFFETTGCFLVPEGYQAGAVTPDPGGLPMRFTGAVDVPYPPADTPITVTGHFDDPGAVTCEAGEGGSGNLPSPMDRAQVVLWCRAQFVVTEVVARP
jgi:hypothetical protein